MACYNGRIAEFVGFVAAEMRRKDAQGWPAEEQVHLVVECYIARRWEGMLVNEQEEDLFFELVRKKALVAVKKGLLTRN